MKKSPVIDKWEIQHVSKRPLLRRMGPFDGEHHATVEAIGPLGESVYSFRFRFALTTAAMVTQHDISSAKSDSGVIKNIKDQANRNLVEVLYGDIRKPLLGILLELNSIEPGRERDQMMETVDKLIRYTLGEEVDL